VAATHPPTLLTLASQALRSGDLVPPGARVLAAVSGGPDSMALVHVLSRLQERFGFRVAACGVDHGLRESAAAELDLAEEACGRWDVPFHRVALGLDAGGNLHARARAARYAALRAKAAELGATRIATGHHADDRAETVILRLARGAGPRGLAVLPLRAGELIRPLLRARRTTIEAHLARHRIPFAVDPSNLDPRFDRARVRARVLPALEELSPRIVDHLNALADRLLEQRGDGGDDEPGGTLVRATQEAIRAFARAEGAGGPLTLELPGGLVATYVRGSLSVTLVKSPKSAPRWKHRNPGGTHPSTRPKR
jgi:tRNA(Ile)-lysidine synthase